MTRPVFEFLKGAEGGGTPPPPTPASCRAAAAAMSSLTSSVSASNVFLRGAIPNDESRPRRALSKGLGSVLPLTAMTEGSTSLWLGEVTPGKEESYVSWGDSGCSSFEAVGLKVLMYVPEFERAFLDW